MKLFKLLSFTFILTFSLSSLNAQETFDPTFGPEGGKVYDKFEIFNGPGKMIFCATDNGIFVTNSSEIYYQPYAFQGSSVYKFIEGKNFQTFILTDHGLYKNNTYEFKKDSLKRVLALSYRDPVTGLSIILKQLT